MTSLMYMKRKESLNCNWDAISKIHDITSTLTETLGMTEIKSQQTGFSSTRALSIYFISWSDKDPRRFEEEPPEAAGDSEEAMK